MVRVAQPSGGETTFEKDLPRSPRTIRVSQPSGGKTTFDKELPRSPRTVRVSQPSGGKTTFEEVPYPETRLRVLKPPGGGSSISFGGEEQVQPSKTTSPTAPHENNKSNGTVQNGNHINGQSPTTNGTCNGTISNGSMTPNGSCTTASSPGSAKSLDTQNRLFGGSDHSSPRERDTPTKPSAKPPKLRDHMRSSIFGDDSGTPSRNGTPNGTVRSSKVPPPKDLPSKVKPEAHNSLQQDSPKTEKPFPELNKTDSKQTDPSVTTKSGSTSTKVPEEAAAASNVTDTPKSCVDLPKPEITITENVDSQNNGTPSAAETSVKETPEPPKPASAPAAQPQQKQRVPPGGFSTALW